MESIANKKSLNIEAILSNKADVMQNLFLFPAILSTMQFCFVFVALFKTGFSFETTVLLTDFAIVVLWIGLFIRYQFKERDFHFSLKNIIIAVCFICCSLSIIKDSVLTDVLHLNCMKKMLDGTMNMDTIFHSSIAESYVTNGCPTTLMNGVQITSYHTGSHALIAIVSRILSVPCFVTYNYIYPSVAYPLFVYLFIKAISVLKFFLRKSKLSFLDIILIELFISGLNYSFASKTAVYDFSWKVSESVCFSLVFILAYILLIVENIKKRNINILLFLITSIFIVLLGYVKITSCLMFAGGLSFFLVRKDFFSIRKWIVMFLYLFLSFSVYISFVFLSPQYNYAIPFTINSNWIFFYFIKDKFNNLFYVIIHYSLVFLPCGLIFLFSGIKKSSSFKLRDIPVENILLETLLLSTIVSVLPGVFIVIHGGGAFNFEYIAIFEGVILFFVLEIPERIFDFLVKISFKITQKDFLSFDETIGKKQIFKFIVCLGCIACIMTRTIECNPLEMIKKDAFPRLTVQEILLHNRIVKFIKIFKPSNLLDDNNYKILTELRKLTQKRKNDYCVFIKDNNELISVYDNVFKDWHLEQRIRIRFQALSYRVIPCYTGLPVINAIYIKDNTFFRGDDTEFGVFNDFDGYGMPPNICGDKVTEENMLEVAANQNKKYVIVVGKDSFEVVPVK